MNARRLFGFAAATLALMALFPGALRAEEDAVAAHLFPPELVMGHQRELALSEDQRAAIKTAIQEAQSRFLDLQWEVQAEARALGDLLAASPVDEAAAVAQAELLMNLETQVKQTQLTLLIRIKNALTAEQHARLAELRRAGGTG